MKSVLISIQPKWCELIAEGKKTIEVRKTAPKLETPFKCYIYMTKKGNKSIEVKKYETGIAVIETNYKMAGKVIGEFVCDKVEVVNAQCSDSGIDLFYHDCKKYGCLSQVEVEKYFGVYDEERTKDLRVMKGNGYAWHISDLKIYDKPKELGEFKTLCKRSSDGYGDKCYNCHNLELCNNDGEEGGQQEMCVSTIKQLTRPPQSWCYVEEVQ